MHLLKTRCAALCAIAFVTITSLSAGCSATTDDPAESDTAPTEGVSESLPEPETVESTASELGACNQCTNCVLYVDCRQPKTPRGLFTYADKARRINSRYPRPGCVAVINTGNQWGHVAYVENVAGATVYIAEGNYAGRCNRRAGTAARLGITGYICF
jgi:hypothetical protein